MVQLNARTARPSGTKRVSTLVMPVQVLVGGEDLLDRGALMSSVAGILEAQLTQHIALFEKMCGPVKHVRLAVRRRKKGSRLGWCPPVPSRVSGWRGGSNWSSLTSGWGPGRRGGVGGVGMRGRPGEGGGFTSLE